jgi:hypothetical protein
MEDNMIVRVRNSEPSAGADMEAQNLTNGHLAVVRPYQSEWLRVVLAVPAEQ